LRRAASILIGPLLSEKRALERYEKLNAKDVEAAQAIIVGD
jgi:hypothetical protein